MMKQRCPELIEAESHEEEREDGRKEGTRSYPKTYSFQPGPTSYFPHSHSIINHEPIHG
jgi:hypothetical protein